MKNYIPLLLLFFTGCAVFKIDYPYGKVSFNSTTDETQILDFDNFADTVKIKGHWELGSFINNKGAPRHTLGFKRGDTIIGINVYPKTMNAELNLRLNNWDMLSQYLLFMERTTNATELVRYSTDNGTFRTYYLKNRVFDGMILYGCRGKNFYTLTLQQPKTAKIDMMYSLVNFYKNLKP